MKQIMEEVPYDHAVPAEALFDETIITERGDGKPGDYYLYYYGANRLSEREFRLPDTKKYREGRPGMPYTAARFMAVE